MKILLCSMSQAGYLYPALAIGRELAAGGDQVTLLGPPSTGGHAKAAGIPYVVAERHDQVYGFNVARWAEPAAQFANVVRTARDLKPDVLVASALSLGALLAGEVLDLPVVLIGFATHLWNYRALGAETPAQHAQRSQRTALLVGCYEAARNRQGMPPRRAQPAEAPVYGAGLLLRGCPALESPGAELPPQVHHVGPCQWEPPTPADELAGVSDALRRNGKRVVYAHLGRTFGGESIWQRLNDMFTNGEYQAVVEIGRSADPQPAPQADITTVCKPWMQELVALSELVFTRGTTAPVSAALRAGRPLLMAPAGSEQPVLTDSCVRAGVARRYLPSATERPDHPIRMILDSDSLRHRVACVSADLRGMPGPVKAAQLIRSSVTGRPSPAVGHLTGAAVL